MSAGIDIPYSDFAAMEAEMIRGPMGDGRDHLGRSFAVYRYTSRRTAKRYDVVVTTGEKEPRCVEYPKYE
ncbi:hypothetical protein C3941_15405 [Kaistia algarum]|uniref:hypothetical protein n=1 Tax=Kaistia algarum TaxID=2083279 RepID=UPI000CE8BC58|nr:hypothetical protein [Kaistia algarum]MCX5514460.1 hypothetical protein [Kaistia algarum]PPE79192.1 hypothetical protein C3941_15405 [Kaistia algarum]